MGVNFIKIYKAMVFTKNCKFSTNLPTHENGNTLDNIAINFDDPQTLEIYHHALYCSDHDAICFRI